MKPHPIHRVKDFRIEDKYVLWIAFTDGIERTIDFEPFLEGELYGPLRDLRVFQKARLDSEVGTIVWPNGADFDPATLHDWPTLERHLRKMAQSWRQRQAA